MWLDPILSFTSRLQSNIFLPLFLCITHLNYCNFHTNHNLDIQVQVQVVFFFFFLIYLLIYRYKNGYRTYKIPPQIKRTYGVRLKILQGIMGIANGCMATLSFIRLEIVCNRYAMSTLISIFAQNRMMLGRSLCQAVEQYINKKTFFLCGRYSGGLTMTPFVCVRRDVATDVIY